MIYVKSFQIYWKDNMIEFKKYIAGLIVGRNIKFKCDCLVGIDVEGRVVDYEVKNNEIIFMIKSGEKLIKIGENHPHMFVEEL